MDKRYDEDWDVLMQFFPKNWEEQAKALGALTRQRKFKSANELMRLLLIHLADGCSMREAVTRAAEGGLTSVSDVALLKRLKLSSEWLRWMASELLKRRGFDIDPPKWLSDYRVKSVDASVITEPGSTGTDWRLHYSIHLFGLQCDQFLITRPDIGESFTNFRVHEGDLWIGDRAYGRYKGFKYINENGGYFLSRYKNKAFTLYDNKDNRLNLLEHLRQLNIGELEDLKAKAVIKGYPPLALRICAIRKSDKEVEESIKKVLQEQKKKQRRIDPDTLEMHKYIILITSLPSTIDVYKIMELYRQRWQIEISFKRLKSILGLGHLPKIDEVSSRAWLHGKLFVALLTQAIVDEGRFFSPWGYPLRNYY